MLNNVNLVGRIGRDLELRETQTGKKVINFSLAVQNKNKKQDGSYDVDFFEITAWNGTAQFVADYLRKGSLIGVGGDLTVSEYQNKEGQDVRQVKINASNVYPIEFLMSKNKDSNSNNNSKKSYSNQNSKSAPAKKESNNNPAPNNNDNGEVNDPFSGDDFDIPF